MAGFVMVLYAIPSGYDEAIHCPGCDDEAIHCPGCDRLPLVSTTIVLLSLRSLQIRD